MKEPLKRLALWAGTEATIEVAVPFTAAGFCWQMAWRVLAEPTPGKPYTGLELALLFGACVALTGWFVSRFAFNIRKRRPLGMFVATLFLSGALMFGLPLGIKSRFETQCQEVYAGEVVETNPLVPGELRGAATSVAAFESLTDTGRVCRVGGVPDNPYLVGTLLRPTWSGSLPVPHIIFLILVAGLSVLGFRDVRIRPTRIGGKLFQGLRLAPGAGLKSSQGQPNPKGDGVVACNNPTLWGEACGQIYAKDKVFFEGERCIRCRQMFVPCRRTLTFKVVSLFTDEVDVLNGLERSDTLSWPLGDPMIADARISGQERWVAMGTITVPDVLSVAQTLRIVEEKLKEWSGHETPRIKEAAQLAQKRASMVSAWVWFGRVSDRLTHARPTTRAMMAIGTTRLRDLVPHGGEDLTLQLDIGLLPVALRIAFRQTFTEDGRKPEHQNSALDLWIPVSYRSADKKLANTWVPRVEGDAIRTWLSIQRMRGDDKAGVTTPLAYFPTPAPNEDGSPTAPEVIRIPKAGSLDMVRVPLDQRGREPTMERTVGDSISEWQWLEWEQIELLRQQCLVLVEGGTQ